LNSGPFFFPDEFPDYSSQTIIFFEGNFSNIIHHLHTLVLSALRPKLYFQKKLQTGFVGKIPTIDAAAKVTQIQILVWKLMGPGAVKESMIVRIALLVTKTAT